MTHPGLHRRARAARRPAAAGAGLSADGRAFGQGAARRPSGRRCRALPTCPSGRMPAWLKAARLAAFHDALATAAPADGRRRRLAGRAPLQRLAYDELLANQLALAIVRESFKAQRGRPCRAMAASAPRSSPRCLSLSPARSARRSKEIEADMGGAAPHVAPAAGRRRLRQNRRGADGHGHRRRRRRAGGADGAHRSAGPPARETIAPLAERARTARRPADGPRKRAEGATKCWRASPSATSTS